MDRGDRLKIRRDHGLVYANHTYTTYELWSEEEIHTLRSDIKDLRELHKNDTDIIHKKNKEINELRSVMSKSQKHSVDSNTNHTYEG